MGSLTDYSEDAWLDHLLNKVAYTPSATLYLGLSATDPTDAATGASCGELANTNGYQRSALSFGAAATRIVDQDVIVTFPQAVGGGWGTANYWFITNNQTYAGDSILAHGAFGTGKLINENATPTVAIGEVDVTINTGKMSNYAANKMLDLMFNNVAYSSPDTYAGFATAIINDAHTGSTITEATGGGYARKLVDENGGASPTWDLATGTTPTLVDNTHDITWTQASADWSSGSDMTSTFVADALTLSQILVYDNDTVDGPVLQDDTAQIDAGDADISLA